MRGERPADAVVVVRPDTRRPWPWWARLLLALLRGVWRLVVFCVRRPARTVAAGLLAGLYVETGWVGLAGLALTLAGLGGIWRSRSPESFDAFVRWPVVAWWRRWWIYRRSWIPVMSGCGLTKVLDRDHLVPGLGSVACDAFTDTVTVQLLFGQTPAHFSAVAAELAHSFGVRSCRVTSVVVTPPVRSGRLAFLARAVDRVRYRDRPDLIRLVFVRRDPLAAVVTPLPVAGVPDLAALPLGRREDGTPYLLRLLGAHLLIAGATGSGKGSVIWSLIRALASGVHSGLVRLWVIDPKGGMELAFGAALFDRFAYGEPAPAPAVEPTSGTGTGPGRRGKSSSSDASGPEWSYISLLEDAVAEMHRRQSRLRGVTRLHSPTVEEPFLVIVIDELAALTAYVTDRDARKRITSALSLLLSQGRAVGISVVGALQDPRKEVLPFRDLFTTRVALRLTEADQVDLVLGDSARNRGAVCDQIPDVGREGVAFVVLDGVPEPVRVRFSYLTDDDIRHLAHHYAPGSPVGPVTAPLPAIGAGDPRPAWVRDLLDGGDPA